jgi:hypothetical protein
VRKLSFAGVLLAIALPLCAQTKGPAPSLPDGRPDLSGVWQGGGPVGDIAEGLPKGEAIPILPEAEKIPKARQSRDDPEANCLPTGVPRIAPYPWRIVQTPTHVFKFWFDFRGHPHTERLHTIERYTRTDAGTLVKEITIDDPGAYARPFKVTFAAKLLPGEDLMEYICQENNQDVEHIKGPTAAPGDPDRPLGTSEQRRPLTGS